MQPSRILLTGGSGRLGSALRQLLPAIIAPSHAELDITDVEQVRRVVSEVNPTCIVHAAAYTDVAGAETHGRESCWQTNVLGTRTLVSVVSGHPITFIHISTDYVFDGARGNYHEDDTLGPVCNYYALTKLVAEESVRTLPRHIIVRTSFRASAWPYPVAYDDVYTSQDYIDLMAPEIALLIDNAYRCPVSTLHIATERKSMFDLARRRRPDVRSGSKREATVRLPDDVSLDTTRWQSLKAAWRASPA